ncbi:MAG: ribonuclease HII [Alphaproteobacteria bacterium]|nr:ribonuclease HII [Alphaproteobacteria bacterium]
MPDLALEMEAGGLVAGIDEAGRGPLAGPVVAAAAILDASLLAPSLAAAIDDSKRLSPRRRRELFAVLPTFARVGLGAASVTEIDRLNILAATMLAMRRAILALGVVPDLALIDGNRAPDLPCPARTLVGGDGICLSIAAASIAAKVVRDRIMTALAQRHPGFGWERNAGYPTLEHRAALVRLGATPHHRRSFAPVARVLQ